MGWGRTAIKTNGWWFFGWAMDTPTPPFIDDDPADDRGNDVGGGSEE